MKEADRRWQEYEDNRSKTFRETIEKYRQKYGRHPPPGFKEWYYHARERNVHNIDDFEQIVDDMRPFWGVEPKALRTLAAEMWKGDQTWRGEPFIKVVKKFAIYLLDMDVTVNTLDQPRIQDKHGFIFAASSIVVTGKLVPVFSECEANVNNDILISDDVAWEDKADTMIWRGVTSGEAQTTENWRGMHRQRLVMMANYTELAGKKVNILVEDESHNGTYKNYDEYDPSTFLEAHTALVLLSRRVVRLTGFYDQGHFVPMDNRFDGLYSLLTYFVGIGRNGGDAYVSSRDFEGKKIAGQGREWAGKVMRDEDIEVYVFGLLLEYARIIDDNQDPTGYPGGGVELDQYDDRKGPPP